MTPSPAACGGAAPTFELVAGGAAIEALGPQWRDLERRSGAGVFQSHGFACAAAAVTAPARPMVAILRRGGRVVALLPLAVGREAGIRVARGLGAPYAQYDGALADPSEPAAAALLLAGLAGAGQFDVCLLRRVRADDPLAPALAAMPALERNRAPFLSLAGTPDLDGLLAGLSANKRKSLRRGRRDLETLGTVAFAVHRGDAAVSQAKAALALKRRWLAATRQLSPALADPTADALLATLGAADPDLLAVSVLSVSGETVAAEIGLVHAGRYTAFLGAIDLAHARVGPGTLQIRETLGWCLAEGLSHYDFLPPADAYKARWTGAVMAVADHGIALTRRGRAWLSLWHGGLRPPLRRAAIRLAGLRSTILPRRSGT